MTVQPESTPAPTLRVRQMHVIWRNTFVVADPLPDFLEGSRERLTPLPCYHADRLSPRNVQPPGLRVLERVSRNVASIGYDDLLRFQFASFEMASLRTACDRHRRPPDALMPGQVVEAALEADEASAWIAITPFLLLHRAGVGIMEYHASFDAPTGEAAPGYTPEQAIELVRLGISQQLLNLSADWRAVLPADPSTAHISLIVEDTPGWHLAVASLRDVAQVMAARLSARYESTAPPRRRRQRKHQERQQAVLGEAPRPTGSTTVVLLETDPPAAADFPAFIAGHAAPLRGIGAMDTFYHERAGWLVERELADNLSVDSEAAVYLLGNSELILYNDLLSGILPGLEKRLRLDAEHAVTYLYAHYTVLLEWVYLQDAILRSYIQRLDALAAAPTPHRRAMIAALQGALADLVQYREGITPFATRVEFLERAGSYHKLDQLAERFECKQELLLSYASEFHDYREARATEFLNWLAGILTGAALADLILALTGITVTQTAPYLGITLGSIALVLAIMALLLRRR